MNYTYKITCITRFPNGSFHCAIVDFKSSSPERKLAVMSFIKNHPEYHHCFILDTVSKSPFTFDVTVKNRHEGCKGFNSDLHSYTFLDFEIMLDKAINKPYFVTHVTSAFCRLNLSASGKSGKFYSVTDKRFDKEWHDGGLLNDSSLYHDKIKHLISRDEFNNVNYTPLKVGE